MCEETKHAAVFDLGGEVKKILAQTDAMGATITKILLTHAHLDYVGGTIELSKLNNLKNPKGRSLVISFGSTCCHNNHRCLAFHPRKVFYPIAG
jgi:ribonuclease BN (tRNA processing enzyme)